MNKEFTSNPPTDVSVVPKVRAITSSHANTEALSVNNLPHLLEKISDTASTLDGEQNDSSKWHRHRYQIDDKTMTIIKWIQTKNLGW